MCWTITLLLLEEQLSWDWQYQWYFSHWHGRRTSSLLIRDHTRQPFPAQPLTCALGACHISSSAVQHAVSTVSAISRGLRRGRNLGLNPTGPQPVWHGTHPGFTRGSFSFLLHMSDLNHNQRRLAGLPPTLWMYRDLRPNEGKPRSLRVLTLKNDSRPPLAEDAGTLWGV